jgi:cyclophilin family peptidyl-prolyl cis-trans isomerase
VNKLLLALFLTLAFRASDVAAQSVVNPNNTVVRLAFSTGGTNLGNIDLELFNEEKPQTVANFLLYVYSGAYSNLVVNRLDNHSVFVLQAGFATITDEPSTNLFSSYEPNRNYGPITNEYQVGPERRNEFGTIAMARIPSKTNSASSQWFLNLRQNSALDTAEGGYTVFGHVVNTSGPDNGTNLLNYFNAVPLDHILNFFLQNFTEVPVSANFPAGTRTQDLYVIDAFILQNGRPRETNAPAFALNEPAEDVFTTNATVRFSGTASDDTELARITFENETFKMDDIGLSLPGSGNWSVDLPLTPGTNHVAVRSVDVFGNESVRARRTVFYSVKRPVVLNVEGPGKVTGIANGQELEVGVNYRVVARPAAGKFFLGWSGSLSSKSRTITFRMVEDGALTARFADTLLGLAKGKYDGLVFPQAGGPRGSLARITLNLSAPGVYFGRLSPIGANYIIRGKFDENGFSSISGRRGMDTLTLSMRLLVDEDSQAILVTYSDGHFVSEGGLFRVQKYSTTNPAPAAGQYTFLVHPSNNTNAPSADAYGFGSVTVDALGKIKMTGALADGVPIKQTTSITKGDRWALYAPAYTGRGGLIGFGQFLSNGEINNVIRWASPDFPGNTNQLLTWSASPYVPPAQARLFNWTNGVVTLSGDDLAAPLTIDVILNEEGSFTPLSNPNNLQLTIPDAAGFFTGSFTHPVTQALTPLRGAVLQSSNIAAGFFGAGANNGAVLIRAR